MTPPFPRKKSKLKNNNAGCHVRHKKTKTKLGFFFKEIPGVYYFIFFMQSEACSAERALAKIPFTSNKNFGQRSRALAIALLNTPQKYLLRLPLTSGLIWGPAANISFFIVLSMTTCSFTSPAKCLSCTCSWVSCK